MKPERIEAYKLRISGHSYNEIQRELGMPKSTLNSWFQGMVLSDAATERLNNRVREGSKNGLIKKNKLQTKEAEQRARESNMEGQSEINPITHSELRLIGAALYWGEGHKRLLVKNGRELTSHSIRFTNSDPAMIHIFVRFLQEVCEIDSKDITATMRLYPHINEDTARIHWMSATGLPREQFRKTTNVISGASKGIRPHTRLPYGTLEIAVNNTDKFHHLMGWIEGVKKQSQYDTISVSPG